MERHEVAEIEFGKLEKLNLSDMDLLLKKQRNKQKKKKKDSHLLDHNHQSIDETKVAGSRLSVVREDH